jgi:hypothetical protein
MKLRDTLLRRAGTPGLTRLEMMPDFSATGFNARSVSSCNGRISLPTVYFTLVLCYVDMQMARGWVNLNL